MNPVRTVLVVAHDYPPIRSAAAEVILQFARYLPEFGYAPVFLTTSRYGGLPADRTEGVYRAGDVVRGLWGLWRPRRVSRVPQESQYRVAALPSQSWVGRLRDEVMIPDTKLGWLLPASRLGRQLVAERQPALVFSSSPPETAHLVGLRLRRHTHLPWVVHLQDGWLFEPPNPRLRGHWLRRRIEARMERQVVEAANAIVTATRPIAEDLTARYPAAAEKAVAITNGYDRTEFLGLSRQRRPDGTFLLVYTGSLSASRQGTSPLAFFQAVASLLKEDPEMPLRVRFVGPISPEEQAMVHDLGLSRVVSFLPAVSRGEAHQHQLDADALLLITAPGQRSVATLKLYDYIGAGVPILALARDNAAAAIVEQYGLGFTAPPDRAPDIALALAKLMGQQKGGATASGFSAAQQQFEWRNLTQELSLVFDRVLS